MQVSEELEQMEIIARRAISLFRHAGPDQGHCDALASARFSMNEALCRLHLLTHEQPSAFADYSAILRFRHELDQGGRFIEQIAMWCQAAEPGTLASQVPDRAMGAETRLADWMARLRFQLRPDLARHALRKSVMERRKI